MGEKIEVYAVVRMDAGQDGEDSVTVKEILPTMEEATAEVARLNRLHDAEGARYFWQTTRYFPSGRQIKTEPPATHLHQSVKEDSLRRA